MPKVKVSGVAVGQWKRNCKKHRGLRSKFIVEKIERAVSLGEKSHEYRDGTHIIRYHDLNILVSDGLVLTVWRDRTRPSVDVSDDLKAEWDNERKQVVSK